MHLEDRTLTCRNCGDPFVFTTGEQGALLSRGLDAPPSRCPRCIRRTTQGPSRENDLVSTLGG